MDTDHFDMHEDISDTYHHLMLEHYVKPAVPLRSLGQGPAEVLAAQHTALHS